LHPSKPMWVSAWVWHEHVLGLAHSHTPRPSTVLYTGTKLESMDHLAELLRVPPTWRATLSEGMQDELVRAAHRTLCELKTPSVATIETQLTVLVSTLAVKLGVAVETRRPKTIVSGLIVKDHIAYRCQMDVCFVQGRVPRDPLIATVITTDTAWKDSKSWYHGNRASRTYPTLFTTYAPTFLLTPSKFKMLAENDTRDVVYSWPCGPGADNTGWLRCRATGKTADSDFLQALGICLLSNRFPKGSPFTRIARHRKPRMPNGEEGAQDVYREIVVAPKSAVEPTEAKWEREEQEERVAETEAATG
jgi:hypothetical protein